MKKAVSGACIAANVCMPGSSEPIKQVADATTKVVVEQQKKKKKHAEISDSLNNENRNRQHGYQPDPNQQKALPGTNPVTQPKLPGSDAIMPEVLPPEAPISKAKRPAGSLPGTTIDVPAQRVNDPMPAQKPKTKFLPAVGPLMDIWSFGVFLYFMVAGHVRIFKV